jgi:hypothetical protein
MAASLTGSWSVEIRPLGKGGMLFYLERENQDHMRDVEMLAGHAALSTTQGYIEADVEAQRRVVDLI